MIEKVYCSVCWRAYAPDYRKNDEGVMTTYPRKHFIYTTTGNKRVCGGVNREASYGLYDQENYREESGDS
jgi:hypothetical protein